MTNLKKLAFACAASALALPSVAHADGGLTFIIDGDTFNNPYTITNSSTAGETVLGFGISLIDPFLFDTETGGPGMAAGTPFTPQGGSDVLTGYTGPAVFADGSTSIDFTFNDFSVGESFSWLIDVDSDTAVTVFGNELIGSTGYADFSNGLRGLGIFEAVAGNDQASQFTIQTFLPTPSVPEPAIWAFMILGFGAIGTAMRRSQKIRTSLKFA